MKHCNHIIRFIVVFIFIGIGFFAVRSYLVPDSFGIYGSYSYGFHRGDSDAEQASIPALYQESESCKECHEAVYRTWSNGGHAGVTCEACHGPWQAHNENTLDTVVKDTSVEGCMVCHVTLQARPAGFPQIDDFASHVKEQGEEVQQDMDCTFCHEPHEPK